MGVVLRISCVTLLLPPTCDFSGLVVLSSDTTSEMDVLWHDCDALGMERAQVRVLEERGEICLCSLLQRKDGVCLETYVGLHRLRYLADQTLEWQLADEEIGRLLVFSDLAQRDSARPAKPCDHYVRQKNYGKLKECTNEMRCDVEILVLQVLFLAPQYTCNAEPF